MQIIELRGHINEKGQLEIDLPEQLRSVNVKVTLEIPASTDEASDLADSVYGLWANQGVDISEEDIDEARREMWGNFPRYSAATEDKYVS